jgi:hypothetical protein
MPNGVYPVPKFRFQDRHTAASPRASLAVRLRVLFHRDPLDQELAQGADPAGSKALELRARQLLSRRTKLAARLEGVLEQAHASAVFTAEVPVRRADVRDCAADLRALADRLRDERSIDVQGVALTSQLLSDGAGPLYAETGYSLRYTIRLARLALDPLGATEDLATAA